MNVSTEQVNAVLQLEPFLRYQHSIALIAETKNMYSLLDKEGNWQLAEINGTTTFCIWPDEAYVEHFLYGPWADSDVAEITFSEFYEDLKGMMIENNYLLNVFPVDNASGFVVATDEFCRDLDLALEDMV